MVEKYINDVDGSLIINPAWTAEQGKVTTVAAPNNAIPIISSLEETIEAQQQTRKTIIPTNSLNNAKTIMQQPDILDKFNIKQQLNSGAINSGVILDGLGRVFSQYEVPVGFLNRFLRIKDYNPHMIIDDSGSMDLNSDVSWNLATEEMQSKYDGSQVMTRWQEVENRLHALINIFAYLPVEEIKIDFLNRNEPIILKRMGMPDDFRRDAHARISQAFQNGPQGGTPIFRNLSQAFALSDSKYFHYLYTDGMPTNDMGDVNAQTIEETQQLVASRNTNLHALNFMSCTNEKADEENNNQYGNNPYNQNQIVNHTEWMQVVEKDTPNTAYIDDFETTRQSVLNNHGPGLAFSYGVWLACQTLAAIDPLLDNIDDPIPFSKIDLENYYGRKMDIKDYMKYFDQNREAQQYRDLLNELINTNKMGRDVLEAAGRLPKGCQYNQANSGIQNQFNNGFMQNQYMGNQGYQQNPGYMPQQQPMQNQYAANMPNQGYQQSQNMVNRQQGPNQGYNYPNVSNAPSQNPNYQPNMRIYNQNHNPCMWQNSNPGSNNSFANTPANNNPLNNYNSRKH